jgi:hypothetical protein
MNRAYKVIRNEKPTIKCIFPTTFCVFVYHCQLCVVDSAVDSWAIIVPLLATQVARDRFYVLARPTFRVERWLISVTLCHGAPFSCTAIEIIKLIKNLQKRKRRCPISWGLGIPHSKNSLSLLMFLKDICVKEKKSVRRCMPLRLPGFNPRSRPDLQIVWKRWLFSVTAYSIPKLSVRQKVRTQSRYETNPSRWHFGHINI